MLSGGIGPKRDCFQSWRGAALAPSPHPAAEVSSNPAISAQIGFLTADYFSGFHSQFWESPTRPWFLIVPLEGRPIAVIPEIGAAGMAATWVEDRRWHLNTVLPLARLVEHELSLKLETPVKLKFDSYALDMVSRATVVAKLAQAGVSMQTALDAVGLADD